MLTVYGKHDRELWNACVKSFHNWDIYYLYEYAYSFMCHGDGDIYLILFENGRDRFCYAVMQSDIGEAPQFQGRIGNGEYFDWETPYGYGGPLTDAPVSEASQELFKKEIRDYCLAQKIVSQFIRFHPLLKNYGVLPDAIETRYLRDTIFMDTESPELIMANMDSKNRNMIRKAQKSGITIVKKDISEFEEFLPMYRETMEKNHADRYYIFEKEYFESLVSMKDHSFILYAFYKDMPVSGSVMYYNDRYMHYHLSGSHMEYRKYAPGNLLLYEAACWAGRNGIKQFHLGGGMAPDDSLFGFKKQFNKNGRAPFVVGRTIFNPEAYRDLLRLRKKADAEFDMENRFMIQYRR